jgi:hypothetical protein
LGKAVVQFAQDRGKVGECEQQESLMLELPQLMNDMLNMLLLFLSILFLSAYVVPLIVLRFLFCVITIIVR